MSLVAPRLTDTEQRPTPPDPLLWARLALGAALLLCTLIGSCFFLAPLTLHTQASMPSVSAALPVALGVGVALLLGVCIVGMFDVRAHIQALRQAAARDHNLVAVLDAAELGVWQRDLASNVIHLDERAQALMGLAPSTTLAALYDRIHAQDVEAVKQAHARALDSRTSDGRYSATYRVVHADGRVDWISAWSRVHYSGEGAHKKAVRLVGTVRDVTQMQAEQQAQEAHQQHLERMVAERTFELKQQTNYLVALLNHVPFGVWLKDAAGRFRVINRKHAQTYGRSPEDIIGKSDAELVASEVARDRAETDRVVMHERRPYLQERQMTGGGARGWFESYKAPILDADGSALGVVGYARDISEQKALEAARKSAVHEANRLAQLRSEFLANVSHEIRTPLNAVLGLAQSGIRDNAGRRSVETFQRILNSGQLLLGVVNDILDYSKIEAGKVTLERVVFTPGDAIDRAVDLLAQQAYAKGLAFTIDEAPDLPGTCYGDPLRLSQILVNLLSNAVKFTERGEIVLRATHDGDAVVLEVSDTGVGMSEQVIERLFQPFEQADASTTRRFGGTGLGLAITRRLVDLMDGTIEVRSRPGEGSRFTVRLAMEHGPSAARAAAGSVRLVGLRAAEAQHLMASLGGWGIQVERSSAADAFHTPCDLVLFSAAGADNPTLIHVGNEIRAGKRVAFVQTPGENDVPFGYLDKHTAVMDRPLRARRIAAAIRERRTIGQVQSATPRLQGIRVLAAEDSEVNRVVLEDMLKAEGVTLTLVENGRLAVERISAAGANAYDVVLTDIHMPELDGYQTAQRIRAIAPQLPIIGVTARSMAEENERCLAAGMVAQVAKPIDLAVLIAAIRKHCGRPGAAAEPAPASVLPTRAGEASAPPTSHSVIDWPGIEIRYRGRPLLIDKLIAASVRSHGTTAERLRNAVCCRDFETVAFLAHSVKGLAGNFVAEALSRRAAAIEALARQQDGHVFSQADELAALADQFIVALSERRRSA